MERLFSSSLGIVLLIIFLVAVLVLLIWLLFWKDKGVETKNEEETFNEVLIENEDIKKTDERVNENDEQKGYVIEKSDDGFFRVKKVGSDRTLRKFSTLKEAESFVEMKELKHD